jgi:hypothetical protein
MRRSSSASSAQSSSHELQIVASASTPPALIHTAFAGGKLEWRRQSKQGGESTVASGM